MKSTLAITILMVGLAGPALAQDRPGTPDAPLTADTPSADNKTDNKKEQKEQKEAPKKPDCKTDRMGDETASPDRKPVQAPEQAPQNVIEYGG